MKDKLSELMGFKAMNTQPGMKKSKVSKKDEKVESFAETLKKTTLKKEEKTLKKEEKKEEDRGAEERKEGQEKNQKKALFPNFKGDLSKLIMYRLAYMDPSLINISLRESLGLDKAMKQELLAKNVNEKVINNMSPLKDLRTLNNLKTRREEKVAPMGDPLAALRNLNTSLKEIAQKEKVRESQIIRQIVDKIDVKKLEKGHEVNIILNPNALGQVAVQIITEGNTVIALFKTTSERTYKDINEEKESLIQALRSRGVKVAKVKVEYVDKLG